MKQTIAAAVGVIAIFGAGFFTGRVSVNAPASNAPPLEAGRMAMPTNAAPMMGSTPLPMPGGQGPSGMQPAPMQQQGMQEPAEESPPMGVVAEVIQVPNYTYLRLTTATGDEWVAVTSTQGVSVGKPVSLARGHRMVDFTSKTLSRTFASIWFGELSPN